MSESRVNLLTLPSMRKVNIVNYQGLAEASTFVEVIEKRQGLKVACLEGIAYRNGWISEEKMRELAKPMLKNQYGQYLLKVIDEMKEEITSDTFTHPGRKRPQEK